MAYRREGSRRGAILYVQVHTCTILRLGVVLNGYFVKVALYLSHAYPRLRQVASFNCPVSGKPWEEEAQSVRKTYAIHSVCRVS